MLNAYILAIILIVVLCVIVLGFHWDEAQTYMKGCNEEQLAAYIDIMKAQLRKNGKCVGGDEFEPDFVPCVIAIALVALCALAGLHFTAIFFLLCFGACAYQAAEDIKALMVVQFAAGDKTYATA
jgi:hypothetical protein